jgi:hypothetical protein
VLAGGLSIVVPTLPWMSGLAQYSILIAIFAVGIGARYIAGAEASQGRTEIEARIARNRKYWVEYDRLMTDPLFRSGIRSGSLRAWYPTNAVTARILAHGDRSTEPELGSRMSRTSDSRQHARNER